MNVYLLYILCYSFIWLIYCIELFVSFKSYSLLIFIYYHLLYIPWLLNTIMIIFRSTLLAWLSFLSRIVDLCILVCRRILLYTPYSLSIMDILISWIISCIYNLVFRSLYLNLSYFQVKYYASFWPIEEIFYYIADLIILVVDPFHGLYCSY